MAFNILAVALSALALLSSSWLAYHQATLMRRANILPVYAELLGEFRSMQFNDHYRFVTQTLPTSDFDPTLGISGLPDEARAAVYDIAYFFQTFATFRLVGILNDNSVRVVHTRIVVVWNAIKPFVEAERRLPSNTAGQYLLRVLEDLAEVRADYSVTRGNVFKRGWSRRRAARHGLERAFETDEGLRAQRKDPSSASEPGD